MRLQKTILLLTCIAVFFACNSKNNKKSNTVSPEEDKIQEVNKPSKAELIIKQSITAHGGNLYDTAHYAFIFRDHTYHLKNDGRHYEYTKTSNKANVQTIDVLKNGKFSRTVNGNTITLTEKEIKSGTGAINSVIYFATLPHKLQDQSVNKTYMGETKIKGQPYAIVGVTFEQEGGGEDFDDEYLYWINANTHKIDYLAYNFHVNKGGVRFRSAYNSRVVDGITFQDYVNYEAEVGTPLIELAKLYEAGKLKELSKIETEKIINLKNN